MNICNAMLIYPACSHKIQYQAGVTLLTPAVPVCLLSIFFTCPNQCQFEKLSGVECLSDQDEYMRRFS
jgi:hypothetical protein